MEGRTPVNAAPEVRIDYVQHALSAMLQHAELFGAGEAAGPGG